ncbi:MAG: carnitine dehydratase [Dehalococcoidia bacterium]|nr:carnitine dehydratase [Dehalococcoidia bacterium]
MSDKFSMLIGGQWVEARSGEVMERHTPMDGSLVGVYPRGGREDVDAAVAAARAAFDGGPWPAMSGPQRGALLMKVAEKLRERQEEMALRITREMGRPIRESRNEVRETAEVFECYAGRAWQSLSEAVTHVPGSMGLIIREPVGVVAVITPWNFPLLLLSWKVAPALAVGCTVVAKPASYTPGVCLMLGEMITEAGFPPGVFNVVTGPGSVVGDALVAHPGVDKVAFTGDTATGRSVMRSASGNVKRVSLELGGKSPNIVFADADIRAASGGAQIGIFFNQGEVCQAGSRLLVQEEVHDELVARLIERAKSLRMGDPMDPETRMGAIVSREQLDTILGYVGIGKEEGADLVYGGSRKSGGIFDRGYYMEPTIFDNVKSSMRIAQEEIFGPVVCVITFKDEEEAIRIANDTIYGLAGAVWTRDIDRAMRVVRRVKAGTMFVNCYLGAGLPLAEMPFGGFKQSGFGRELGKAGMEQYTEIKSVHMRLTS